MKRTDVETENGGVIITFKGKVNRVEEKVLVTRAMDTIMNQHDFIDINEVCFWYDWLYPSKDHSDVTLLCENPHCFFWNDGKKYADNGEFMRFLIGTNKARIRLVETHI